MIYKNKFYSYLVITFLFVLTNNVVIASEWRVIADGLEYQELTDTHPIPWSHIHVFRIDLKYNNFSLITAKALHHNYAVISEYAKFSNALLAINGGFFDKNYHPLGLRISNTHKLNSLRPISWWGIFYIKNNQPYISNTDNNYLNADFAVQSGPRIIIDGQISKLKFSGYAERSAIGITEYGKIIILVTEHNPISIQKLAHLMYKDPINCIQALNLDGGSSSQLYANLNKFYLNVHNFASVSDAIIITKSSV